MADPIIVTLIITLKPERPEEIYATFPAMVEETRKFKGFRSLKIHRHADVPGKAIFVEEWDSFEDYDAYRIWRSTNDASNAIRSHFAEPPVYNLWPIKIV
jgi:quinol monooxygenase YgiN